MSFPSNLGLLDLRMTTITMMITWCMWAYSLNALMVYFNVKNHDIWEGNVPNNKGIGTIVRFLLILKLTQEK